MGALYFNNKFVCGSVLLNLNYALTAAHCIHHLDMLENYYIIFNSTSPDKVKGVKIRFEKITIHPKYDIKYLYNVSNIFNLIFSCFNKIEIQYSL